MKIYDLNPMKNRFVVLLHLLAFYFEPIKKTTVFIIHVILRNLWEKYYQNDIFHIFGWSFNLRNALAVVVIKILKFFDLHNARNEDLFEEWIFGLIQIVCILVHCFK